MISLRQRLSLVAIFLLHGASAVYPISETPKDFLPVPRDARPMDGLLPTRGIDSHKGGLLKVNSKYMKVTHSINFETREVEIVHFFQVDGSPDSIPVYGGYYRELDSYSQELNRLAMYRFWLGQFIGRSEAEAGGGLEPSLQWELPVNVPEWMKRWGADRPQLKINGSYKVIVEGKTIRHPGEGRKDNWFPSFNMNNEPSFSVTGSIGRLIHIQINNEEGFGTSLRDQLKIAYRGEGDELEDNIIQEIEAGNTSLSLTGTNLTGYTEQHKGLFGIKTRLKLGDLNITSIASTEGGAHERQTLGTEEEETEYFIEDRNMSLYKHFFLEIKDRQDYAAVGTNAGAGSLAYKSAKSGVRPQVWVPAPYKTDPQLARLAIAFALDLEGHISDVSYPGRWLRLEQGKDFVYNPHLRMLTVHSGRQNQAIAVRWENDPLQKNYGIRYKDELSPDRLDTIILLKNDNGTQPPLLDSLMWRNVYNIGKVDKQDRDRFSLRVVDDLNSEIQLGRNLAIVLGLTKDTLKTEMDYDNPDIFDFENGLLVLPCRTLDAASFGDDHCLTPFKRVHPEAGYYSVGQEEISSLPAKHKLKVIGRHRKSTFDVRQTSHSVSGGGCLDITPGTEKLMLNGATELIRDIDYEVLYEVGQITLLSLRAKDPGAKIDISYECTPLFQIQDKILLGTRLEYGLDAISDESILGATILYKNQSTTVKRPQLDREPFEQYLWGFNSTLAGTPEWMTKAVNALPLVETEAPSRVKFDFEVAQSYFDPNTKGTALLDDFESSKREFSFPLTIYSWFKASPPGNNPGDANYVEDLDYQHNGEFIWHSNILEQFSRIYGATSSSRTNTRESRILKFMFSPNDNLRGRSWGGVMRGLSLGLRNQSRKRVLEVVVRGREGVLGIDLGKMSEDLSIAGYAPNKVLDAEVNPGEFTNKDDLGLDGLKSGEGEAGQRWECKPSCYALPYDPEAFPDPALDDWEEPNEGETDPDRRINGTENNNQGTGGITYDTEDINRDGTLNTLNQYVRYSIDLEAPCSYGTHCEDLVNGWRKYQIPLHEAENYEIVSTGTADLNTILANVELTRMWMGRLPNGVTQSELLLARVALVGNTWEEGDRNREYEVPAGYFITDEVFITQPPLVSDSNALRVTVINNREEGNLEEGADGQSYVLSPNTKVERDPDTDEPIREQSLVLSYENLHAAEKVHATRLMMGDEKDLTMYSRLLMEVHPQGASRGQNQVSVSLMMGRDEGNEESVNYYEIKVEMDPDAIEAVYSDTGFSYEEKQRQLWSMYAIDLNLDDLAALKNDPTWERTRQNTRKQSRTGSGEPSLILSVRGDPSLGKINWMRLKIEVDSTASELQSGQIWINDLRLEGVNATFGTSIRTSLQTDFADFINISGNLTASNGNFLTMTAEKKTPASSKSELDYNSNFSIFANKFFPDQWGLSIPFSVQYSGRVERPFTKQPYSDVPLERTGLTELMEDAAAGELSTESRKTDYRNRESRLYQSRSTNRTLTTSYRKDWRTENFLTRAALERPTLEWAFRLNQSASYNREDTTASYTSKFAYSLSPAKPISFTPFSAADRWKATPKIITDFKLSPYPERLNLTLVNLTFKRIKTIQNDDILRLTPGVEERDWDVDLRHGMDMAWRPLGFLNLTYRLDVTRDFDEQHAEFSRDVFWSENAGTSGFMARKIVFDLDSSGADYAVLRAERNRNDNFQWDFTPKIISWLPLGAKFNSAYDHTRSEQSLFRGNAEATATIVEHFDAGTSHDIRFNSGIKLSTLFTSLEKGTKDWKWLGKGFESTRKGLDKLSLRNIDANYVISHKYSGEEFTFSGMRNRDITPMDFYLYQLGMVYDPAVFYSYDRFKEEVVLGRPDRTRFDYLSAPMLSVEQNPVGMYHNVNRTADVRTGFTVPYLDLRLTGTLKWSKNYSMFRDWTRMRGAEADTSLTWPDISVQGQFSNFARKIGFLKKNFSTVSANTAYKYALETKTNLFSSSQETQTTTHSLSPLLKINATQKSPGIRYENSINFSRSFENVYDKTPTGDSVVMETYPINPPRVVKTATFIRAADGHITQKKSMELSDVFTLSYDVQTRKGVQVWRWYVKLENNLRLKMSIEGGWSERIRFDPVREPELEQLRLKFRPEASYNFTRKIDGLLYAQYLRSQEFHTEKEEVTHEIEIHGEFTMRF